MKFSLTILGSSSALPTSDRFLTAQVLNVNERFFLLDCGEGTQVQLRRFKIPFGKINHIFISHLHGDHVFGLPGLLSTFSMLGRVNELHIYGPPGLKQIINQFLGQFYTHLGFTLTYHPLGKEMADRIYEDKTLEIFSLPLQHRIDCWGFIVREKEKQRNIRKEAILQYKIPIREIVNIKNGQDLMLEDGNRIPNEALTLVPEPRKSFAYISDTVYLPELAEILKEVTLLYHEATFLTQDEELAQATGHSTTRQAGQMARLARAGQLVIGHFSTRYGNYQRFGEEAGEVFSSVQLAEDGKTFAF